ncbi:MAG: serine/threonine-protein kinase, partial [Myxococcota bacterium]
MDRITGLRLGRYEVTRPLAEGGMAQVYLGLLRGAGGFEKRVVLKVLHSRYLGESDFVKMFLDEGRILARLRHPNVVDVFEVECVDGVPYLAMEFVNGPTINALQKAALKAGRSRIEHYVFLLRQVADALSAAHTLSVDGVPLGLVHRDVSSQNVLVDATSGTAKLIDFGIARMADALHEQTQVGVVKGKPHYLAPEVRAGAPYDARADLYAMGVLLYRCAAGRMPFREADLARSEPCEPYLPIERVPGLPDGLAEIVRRAMAPSPEDRYATAAELSADLRRVHEAAGVDARAVSQWIGGVLPGDDDWGRRGESQSGTAHASLQRLVSEPGRAPT